MLDWILDPNAWIALLTLTALEIVLGIDNKDIYTLPWHIPCWWRFSILKSGLNPRPKKVQNLKFKIKLIQYTVIYK
jgi:hypothetical protein